jgi:cephalosporin hydroxylase
MIDYSRIHAIPEIDSLLEIAKSLPPNPVIVEIGTYLGGTTVRLAEARLDAIITTIDCCDHGDNWNEPYNEYVQTYVVEQVLKDKVSKQHLLNNISRFDNITFVQGYSPECASDWNSGIDLYFEDGDHGNPNLYKNLEFWSKFVKVGGYLVAHDYCDDCPEVIEEIDKMVGTNWKKVLEDRRLIVLQKGKI